MLQDLLAYCSKSLTPCNKQQEDFWACSAFGLALYKLQTLELTANTAFYQMGHTRLGLNRWLSLWIGGSMLNHPQMLALV